MKKLILIVIGISLSLVSFSQYTEDGFTTRDTITNKLVPNFDIDVFREEFTRLLDSTRSHYFDINQVDITVFPEDHVHGFMMKNRRDEKRVNKEDTLRFYTVMDSVRKVYESKDVKFEIFKGDFNNILVNVYEKRKRLIILDTLNMICVRHNKFGAGNYTSPNKMYLSHTEKVRNGHQMITPRKNTPVGTVINGQQVYGEVCSSLWIKIDEIDSKKLARIIFLGYRDSERHWKILTNGNKYTVIGVDIQFNLQTNQMFTTTLIGSDNVWFANE